MFKKSDILPLILAFLSTMLLVTLGFAWLSDSKLAEFGQPDLRQSKIAKITKETKDRLNLDSLSAKESKLPKFVMPTLVPQGTSVTINGSSKLDRLNRALRKNFHQQYPGTIISTSADGNNVGLDLLSSRDVDLAALDRPLNEVEKASGLQEIPLQEVMAEKEVTAEIENMYYVYLEPLSPDAEAFLGYAFSHKGIEAVLEP